MNKNLIAIVPAAGIGARATEHTQKGALPKQYRLIKGVAMLRRSVLALLREPRITQVRVILAPDDAWAQAVLQDLPRTALRYCGGPTRGDTVNNALRECDLGERDWVMVHDAARPGLPCDALSRLIDTCWASRQGGLLAMPVSDTVKRVRQGSDKQVDKTLDRSDLWLAQTPQLFPGLQLKQALLAAQAAGHEVTDEASAIEILGLQPLLVKGSARNFKVTWPEDFELMEKWL